MLELKKGSTWYNIEDFQQYKVAVTTSCFKMISRTSVILVPKQTAENAFFNTWSSTKKGAVRNHIAKLEKQAATLRIQYLSGDM